MSSTQPVAKIPVVYISSPAGILSGISAQLVGMGACPLVGWTAGGFVNFPPDAVKALVAKADALVVSGIVSGDMNTEIAGATESGIPVFHDWAELVTFISDFKNPPEAKPKKAAKKG